MRLSDTDKMQDVVKEIPIERNRASINDAPTPMNSYSNSKFVYPQKSLNFTESSWSKLTASVDNVVG